MNRVLSLLFALVVALVPLSVQAHGDEADAIREHRVYSGQRLGSIAKRYNVSIAAICHANGIDRKKPIKPGQDLIIPSRTDKDGEKARQLRVSGKWKGNDSKKAGSKKSKNQRASGTPHRPQSHTVYSGQRLGSIAKRYNVTVQAICHANNISRRDPIKPKQKLLIPARNDVDGSYAREFRIDGKGKVQRIGGGSSGGGGSWSKYMKRPKKRGYAQLIGHTETWKGYILGRGDVVLSKARREISRVLTAPSNRKPVDRRLVRLLAQVSDAFGGRPLRIISGYRTTSYVSDSRHKKGQAVDFRIPGVPNEALRDYLRTFKKVGVGYYPNSTFVHFDVRDRSAYWIDYSGPGEAPKLKPD